MKIKCPFMTHHECNFEFDDNSLYNHFQVVHPPNIINHYLVNKLFKIHEKIESLEQYAKTHPQESKFDCVYTQIRVLESLLENEK